jgi:hypothetical protein
MTWASLFLECTGLFLVWWPTRSVRYAVVTSMILLHVGIDLAMNMHIFEWLSIIGWCMFLFESSEPQPKTPNVAPPMPSKVTFWHRHSLINFFLVSIILTFLIDTFPILHVYEGLVCLLHPMTGLSVSSPALRVLSKSVARLNKNRKNALVKPFIMRYLDPLGLYQDVWDMYSDASDEFVRFEITLSVYKKPLVLNGNVTDDAQILKNVNILSPDWGTMTWYEKKRWQRPMTMYDNFHGRMCFDCFVQYQARQYLKERVGKGNDSASGDFGIASIRLEKHTVAPPPPPDFDDWWNWKGWFYANAKQTTFERLPTISLFVLNFCNDLSDQCNERMIDGLCDAVSNHHVDRYSYNRSITDQDRFAMTQLCRRSCLWCPEHGYNADTLLNGTRISVIWPIPSSIILYGSNSEDSDYAAMYYDATIVQVVDHPMKRYLLKYDSRLYESEWFDPITLRDRGYRLISRGNHYYSGDDDEIDSEIDEVLSEQNEAKFFDEL